MDAQYLPLLSVSGRPRVLSPWVLLGCHPHLMSSGVQGTKPARHTCLAVCPWQLLCEYRLVGGLGLSCRLMGRRQRHKMVPRNRSGLRGGRLVPLCWPPWESSFIRMQRGRAAKCQTVQSSSTADICPLSGSLSSLERHQPLHIGEASGRSYNVSKIWLSGMASSGTDLQLKPHPAAAHVGVLRSTQPEAPAVPTRRGGVPGHHGGVGVRREDMSKEQLRGLVGPLVSSPPVPAVTCHQQGLVSSDDIPKTQDLL